MVCVGAANAEPRMSLKKVTTLNDDGAWSWFSDERAIVSGLNVFVGSVANGSRDTERKGDVDVVSWNTATGRSKRFTLHDKLQADDHNNPALLRRPDGRILAVYAKHGPENRIYHRISRFADDVSMWGEAQTFTPSETSRITYSNVFHLPGDNEGRGRIHNFYRGYDASFKPSWSTSDDGGATWTARGLFIDFPHKLKHRPYVKYISNGHDTIHFVFTEGHPRDYDNGVYHAVFRGGAFYTSDGKRIRKISDGPMTPTTPSRLFPGAEDAVAWVHDLHLDKNDQPVVVYSVQKDPKRLPRAHADSGKDLRYRYARWDGKRWRDFQIAHAGTRLYAGEDDYTGGICIDPAHTNRVVYSANADPFTGAPLPGGRHELFVAESPDGGVNWRIKQLTRDSKTDQLRPHIPVPHKGAHVLLWLGGTYRSYTDYDLKVIGALIVD